MRLAVMAAMLTLCLSGPAAGGDDWPTRPITLVAPFAPGGPIDVAARIMGVDVDTDGWNALFFPKGTPDPIVRKLNAATSEALDTPWIRARMAGLGLTVPPPEHRSVEWLARLVPREIAKWGMAVKASGVSVE